MNTENNAVELNSVVREFWKSKVLLLSFTIFCSICGFLYANSQPDIYTSSTTLAPSSSENDSALNSITSQFGGLASLAGVNLGQSTSNNIDLAIEILKSRRFINDFVEKHKIQVELVAAIDWNRSNNKLKMDDSLYSVSSQKWIRVSNSLKTSDPTPIEIHTAFSKILNIKRSQETGFIDISISHYSPFIAQEWLKLLIEEINSYMKLKDQTEANRSVSYLENQLDVTKLTDFRVMLYKMLDEQTKVLMFSNIKDEYIFETIDPPSLPEAKSNPNRVFITILFVFFGLLTSIVYSIVRAFYA